MEDSARMSRWARTSALGTTAVLALALCGTPARASCAGTAGDGSAASYAAKARELLAEARAFAGEDEHSRSITCALAAIDLDPSLEPEAALLLGHQLTWADRPDEAIAWYRRHLEEHPGDREARAGLARALSWSGNDHEARGIYEELAKEDPGDVEALAGLARLAAWAGDDGESAARARDLLRENPDDPDGSRLLAAAQNRRGRHREAEAIYEELLNDDASDRDARVGRARARYWMGEATRALKDLEMEEGAEGVELRESIRGSRAGSLEFGYSRFKDVDDQEIATVLAAAELEPDPMSSVRVEARRGIAEEPGSGTVRVQRILGGGARRFDRAWAIHAYAGAGRISAEDDVPAGEGETIDASEVRRTIALVDAWATWTPADWTRFDAGASRGVIETPKALARGVVFTQLSVGASRRASDRILLDGSLSWADFSDDNARRAAAASVEFAPRMGGPILLLLGGSALSFDRTLDHGYYNPEKYDVIYAETRVGIGLGDHLRIGGFARLSSEREDEGSRFGVGAGGADLTWQAARSFAVDVFARKSTSRFDTSSGYEREGWGLTVRLSP